MAGQANGAGTPASGAKPNKGASRKRIRLVSAAVLALSVWAGGTAWGQMEKFDMNADRMDALDTKLEAARMTNEKLKREIERLSDPEYREERMRKDMHLSKEGETVFDVPRSNP